MAIKVLHAADFHLDTSYIALSEEKARLMRQEQRETLLALAERAEAERVQLVLLAGDLFDSDAAWWETREAMEEFFARFRVPVFIAPGNHDYFSPASPWAAMKLPENVYLFDSPQIRSMELPNLGCRVYGAGFTSSGSEGLLRGFRAGRSSLIDLMVLHADLRGGRYSPITEAEIAASGLTYLALGHIHSFSGVKKAGNTFYAYPGCLTGRGFDEAGDKGFLLGTVGKDGCDLDFVPFARRRYQIVKADLTGAEEPEEAVLRALEALPPEDIVRLILTGEAAREVDANRLQAALARFFAAQLRDETFPRQALFSGAGEDSLRGLFLLKLREKLEAEGDPRMKERIRRAARYGLAALDGREAWRP